MELPHYTRGRALTIAVISLLIIISGILLLFYKQNSRARIQASLVAHTEEVLYHSAQLQSAIDEMESLLNEPRLAIDSFFTFSIHSKTLSINQQLSFLKNLTADNVHQQRNLDSLNYYLKAELFRIKNESNPNRNKSTIQNPSSSNDNVTEKNYIRLKQIILRMQTEESSLLHQRQMADTFANSRLRKIVLTILLINLLLAGLLLGKNFQDLLGQRQMEALLKGKEQELGMLTENMRGYAVIMLDAAGNISRWNPAAEALTGYKAEEIIGKPNSLFFSHDEVMQGKPMSILKTAETLRSFETDGLRLKKDGTVFSAHIVYAVLRDENEQTQGYSVLLKDISEDEKARETMNQLAAQVDKSNDAIFIIDLDFKIQTWNKGAEKLYGFSRTEAMGKDPNELLQTAISKEDLARSYEEIKSQEYWQSELRRKTKDGREIIVRTSVSPFRDPLGTRTGHVLVSHDITDEKKLQEQVNYLAKLVEQSSEAIISCGLDFRIMSWNIGAEKLFGYSKNEAVGKKAGELAILSISQTAVESKAKSLEGIPNLQTESICFRKDRSTFYAEINRSILKRPTGETESYVFIVKDISARKRLEDELKKTNEFLEQKIVERTEEIYENEKKFRALIENSGEGITLTDAETTAVYRSPAAFRIVGSTPMTHTVNRVHPEDIDEVRKKNAESLANPGIPIPFQCRVLHNEDYYIWLEGTLTNMLDVPAVNAIVANFRDISNRKKDEEKLRESESIYRSLFENMLHGFAYCQPIFENEFLTDFIFVAVNKEYESMLGVSGLEGQKISGIFPGMVGKDSQFGTVITQVLHDGQPLKFETYIALFDKWFAISLYRPKPGFFVSLIDDISDRKAAETRTRELNVDLEARVAERTEQLKKINNELEAFTYSVSHDLRAPLRGIVGFAAILEEEYGQKLDEEARRITGIIKRNTVKMGNLIDDLLAFSRMGKQDLSKSKIDMQALVDEVIEDLEQESKYSLTYTWHLSDLPAVEADRPTIRQVWVNLISNAMKYSSKSSRPEISIGSYSTGEEIVFFVKDNGVGFDEKYLKKLFKVFQRLHSSQEFEGTGVGLALVDKIISRYGGRVWAQGAVNQGASFYFSLPSA